MKKKTKQYEFDKDTWLSIVKEQGFQKKSIDKVLDYIDNHIRFELQYPILFNCELKESLLPNALVVLSKLDKLNKLDKVEFVNNTSGSMKIGDIKYIYEMITHGYAFNFNNEELLGVADVEAYMNHVFSEETFNQLSKIIDDCDVLFIFILFAKIVAKDETIKVFHRYQKKSNNVTKT